MKRKIKGQLLLLSIFLFATSYATASEKIVGCWQLVDYGPRTQSFTKRGVRTSKIYYSEDGYRYILGTNRTFGDVRNVKLRYEFSGKFLTQFSSSGKSYKRPVSFPDPGSMIVHRKNLASRYKKLGDKNACEQEIEPTNVLVLKTKDDKKQLTNLDIQYDNKDYSRLPLNKRILGLWEINAQEGRFSVRGVEPDVVNMLYAFEGKYLYRINPGDTKNNSLREAYKIKGSVLKLKMKYREEKLGIKFNKWGHLILANKEIALSLKLIQKDTLNLPQIPTKIPLVLIDVGQESNKLIKSSITSKKLSGIRCLRYEQEHKRKPEASTAWNLVPCYFDGIGLKKDHLKVLQLLAKSPMSDENKKIHKIIFQPFFPKIPQGWTANDISFYNSVGEFDEDAPKVPGLPRVMTTYNLSKKYKNGEKEMKFEIAYQDGLYLWIVYEMHKPKNLQSKAFIKFKKQSSGFVRTPVKIGSRKGLVAISKNKKQRGVAVRLGHKGLVNVDSNNKTSPAEDPRKWLEKLDYDELEKLLNY